eukprot:CAMPEP_0167769012 /NCGR_PEP_ID=MMETSP0110_2-20121227/17042_1 /TAXON_ID=629695 /ORGANISM="Gymnochlora sp., Strain CCMP2014" /LENGTH=201 /DNA_ID=CAMNT_0007657861 /DNA_START=920 /DNA_END=1522 /DNA_ORIENTATION=-
MAGAARRRGGQRRRCPLTFSLWAVALAMQAAAAALACRNMQGKVSWEFPKNRFASNLLFNEDKTAIATPVAPIEPVATPKIPKRVVVAVSRVGGASAGALLAHIYREPVQAFMSRMKRGLLRLPLLKQKKKESESRNATAKVAEVKKASEPVVKKEMVQESKTSVETSANRESVKPDYIGGSVGSGSMLELALEDEKLYRV